MLKELKWLFKENKWYWTYLWIMCKGPICGGEKYHLLYDDFVDSLWHDKCAPNFKIMKNFFNEKNKMSEEFKEKYGYKDTTLKPNETCCQLHLNPRCQSRK